MKKITKSSVKNSINKVSAQLDIASKQADILAQKAARGKSRNVQIDLVRIFSYIASVSFVVVFVFALSLIFIPGADEFVPFPFTTRHSGIINTILLILTYAVNNFVSYVFLTTLGITAYIGAQKIEDEIIREDERIQLLEISGAHALEDKPVKRAMQRLIAGEEKAKEKTPFVPGTITHADFAENIDFPVGLSAADNGGGGLEAVAKPSDIPPDHHLEDVILSKNTTIEPVKRTTEESDVPEKN
jgi:hypothetical protein